MNNATTLEVLETRAVEARIAYEALREVYFAGTRRDHANGVAMTVGADGSVETASAETIELRRAAQEALRVSSAAFRAALLARRG